MYIYIIHADIPINIGLIVDNIWTHRYPEGVVDNEPNHKLYTRGRSGILKGGGGEGQGGVK